MKMIKIIVMSLLLLIGLMVLMGCTSTIVEPATNQQTEKIAPTESQTKSEWEIAKEDCESKGGQQVGCESLTPTCSLPTKDGGKPCSDSDECEQECVAPPNCEIGKTNVKGTCAKRTFLVCDGVQRVEDGTCDAVMIS